MALNLFAPIGENSQKDLLVEFKAGKMNMDKEKWVRADKRKGQIQLRQSDDGLIHFIWKERSSGHKEHDLIIFPDDAKFRKVDESNGRVYVLEWINSSKKFFFWMQEPKDDNDETYCHDINKYINEPPQPSQAGQGGLGLSGLGDLGNLDQKQIMQLLASAQQGSRQQQQQQQQRRQSGQPSSVPAATASSGASKSSQADAIRDIIRNIGGGPPPKKVPSLNEVVDVDEIISKGLFENEEVVKQLAEFLPEGSPVTAENMKEHVRSPQLQQAIGMFNAALRSGELESVMASFGLNTSSIGPNSTIEDFLLAIQKQAKDEKNEEKKFNF